VLTAYTCQAVVCQVQQLHVLQRHKLIQDAHIACQSPARQAEAQDSAIGCTHNTSPRLTCSIDFPRIVREAKVFIISVDFNRGAQNVAIFAPTLPLAAVVHLLKCSRNVERKIYWCICHLKRQKTLHCQSVLADYAGSWQPASSCSGNSRQSCLSALQIAAVPALLS